MHTGMGTSVTGDPFGAYADAGISAEELSEARAVLTDGTQADQATDLPAIDKMSMAECRCALCVRARIW